MLGCRVRMDPASAVAMMGQVTDAMAQPVKDEAGEPDKDKDKDRNKPRAKAKAKAAVVKQVCVLAALACFLVYYT